jgi:DNA modification methylase
MWRKEKEESEMLELNKIYNMDCLEGLKQLPNNSIDCCVTSPPYWGLRDYGVEGQLGLEKTPEAYVERMVEVFREVRRVLRDDGTLWLNLGDSYTKNKSNNGGYSEKSTLSGFTRSDTKGRQANESGLRIKLSHGLKKKDLIGIPWRVAFALQADGWYLRSDIIWHKPNPMPESVTDRPTKAHEYIFLLTKKRKYFYDREAIREPAKPWNAGRMSAPKMGKHRPTDPYGQQTKKVYDVIKGANRRTVWTIATQPYPGAHFATFPPKLIELCILAGTSPKACEVCGAPWERVVEREPMEIKRSDRGMALGKYGKTAASGTMIKPATSVTTGWQPTCTCQNEGKGRCIVLDPFMGSGTTGMVAAMYQRNFIGFELNPEYCKMAERRIEPYLMQ